LKELDFMYNQRNEDIFDSTTNQLYDLVPNVTDILIIYFPYISDNDEGA
jgi:hypothetical protein